MTASSRLLYFCVAAATAWAAVPPKFNITTVAGFGMFDGDNGPAVRALLNQPDALVADKAGNLYICDSRNQRIRKVSTDGTITTIAGTGNIGSSGDGGPAIAADLNYPRGVTLDGLGNLYFVESTFRLRKVSPDGLISTVGVISSKVAGNGFPDESVASVNLLAADGNGNVYFVGNCCGLFGAVEKMSAGGEVTLVEPPYNSAWGWSWRALAADPAGNVYAYYQHTDSRLNDYEGVVRFANDGTTTWRSLPAPGAAWNPLMAVNPQGTIFVTLSANAISSTNTDPQWFGSVFQWDEKGAASVARISETGWTAGSVYPISMALGPNGQIYVGLSNNTVIQADGNGITGIAGAAPSPLLDGQPALRAPLGLSASFTGLALDNAGNLYLADAGHSALRKISPDGIIHTVIQRLSLLTGLATAPGVPGTVYFGWGGMVSRTDGSSSYWRVGDLTSISANTVVGVWPWIRRGRCSRTI
jgi:hypothetical protein